MTEEYKNVLKLILHVYGSIKVHVKDICEIKTGKCFTKAELTNRLDSIYPVFFQSVKPSGKHYETNARKGSTIIINSANAGDITYCSEDSFITRSCWSLTSELLEDKYLYYFLLSQTDYFYSKTTGLIPGLKKSVVEELEIILLTKEKQKEIINIIEQLEKNILYKDEINMIDAEYKFLRENIFSKLEKKVLDTINIV